MGYCSEQDLWGKHQYNGFIDHGTFWTVFSFPYFVLIHCAQKQNAFYYINNLQGSKVES